MNNEVLNNSKTGALKLNKFANDTPIEIDYLWEFSRATYKFGITLFIINLIIYLSTMKKINQSKLLIVISIIAMSISIIGKNVRDFVAGDLVDMKQTYSSTTDAGARMIIVACIIQIIIFILLIRNIIKNKKKEENPKCQE